MAVPSTHLTLPNHMFSNHNDPPSLLYLNSTALIESEESNGLVYLGLRFCKVSKQKDEGSGVSELKRS